MLIKFNYDTQTKNLLRALIQKLKTNKKHNNQILKSKVN